MNIQLAPIDADAEAITGFDASQVPDEAEDAAVAAEKPSVMCSISMICQGAMDKATLAPSADSFRNAPVPRLPPLGGGRSGGPRSLPMSCSSRTSPGARQTFHPKFAEQLDPPEKPKQFKPTDQARQTAPGATSLSARQAQSNHPSMSNWHVHRTQESKAPQESSTGKGQPMDQPPSSASNTSVSPPRTKAAQQETPSKAHTPRQRRTSAHHHQHLIRMMPWSTSAMDSPPIRWQKYFERSSVVKRNEKVGLFPPSSKPILDAPLGVGALPRQLHLMMI